MSSLILLGYVTRPFGIKGGVIIKQLSEESNSLSAGKKVMIKRKNLPSMKATVSRIMSGGRLFFEEIPDKTTAESFRGAEIFLERGDLPPLEAHEFYLADLMDARVLDTDNSDIGRVVGFSHNGAQDLLLVKLRNGNVASVPLIKPIVVFIDYQEKIITIDPPDGLLSQD